ncbi:thiosulfate/3-mercaptopyruvate sulfurtransferase [Luteimonas cucumeris]|uniref:Thiosulfate/3-mercaptopyruvate sulfurtransferase n=1 Tax=Luteimonas cucumeris TaxID=985012 RepID=A0A562LB41_9GAMM|nr:sulfurtransferase [Luteimonas cucumeris]TWI04873.1 thiosulfate/3-mercaptopyruvate sulfurtransferase [Luteimonas cucumeris]
MTGWTTLVSAETLADALYREDLVVVDCRFSLADTASGERAYARSHLPGAVYAHLDRDLSDHRKQDAGRHPWPEAADFTVRLGSWGISPRTQVVAYDDGDGAHAARLWFLLRSLGHERVAVLDGGWARWQQLGLPTQVEIPTPRHDRYDAAFDATRLLDALQVQSHLERGGLLLDARSAERFRGEVEPIDRVAGHVPGARNRPYALNLAEGRFKSSQQLSSEFRELLQGHAPDEVVAMCGSGVTACHHLLAMAHAGLPGAKLFTGSWSGWISDPARPVAAGDR